MDSNRIKNVALGARTTLMREVDAALERVLAPDSPERVANGQDVDTIERSIHDRGRKAVVEQVAYTWFNRLCALRYMDVRGYTPVGLVSPRAGETLPAVLADARRGIYAAGLDISQRDKAAISSVLNGDTSVRDPLGRAYVMLLVAACKTYERSMDYLFGAGRDLGPAIELLAPTDLLSEGSLLQRICTGLDDSTCNEGVEVMGWLYQFYISERRDAFLDSNAKANASDIAPATQLFTPSYIVHFLVENTLGRLWMFNFPDSELKDHMQYYVEPEEPEEGFLKIYSPEDITFLDPACGSGHILVYAFDLLYYMYEEEGYRPTDIPELILTNNLTGLEIDERAAEIASFCLEMKALERDVTFLSKDVDANIVVINRFDPNSEERKLIPGLNANASLMSNFAILDEIGSLYIPTDEDIQVVRIAADKLSENGSLEALNLRAGLSNLQVALSALTNSYSMAVTNPPYLTSGKMNNKLSNWLSSAYPEEKSDLYSCFITRCQKFAGSQGYSALVTMQSWMFLASFKRLRTKLRETMRIVTMAHFGAHAFDTIGGEVVSTTATVFHEKGCEDSLGIYYRLVDGSNGTNKATKLAREIAEYDVDATYRVRMTDFTRIPDEMFVYWALPSALHAFKEGTKLINIAQIKKGLGSGDKDRFLRLWWEPPITNMKFDAMSREDAMESRKRWFPLNKGGGFRKWYGNNDYVVNWKNDGEEIRAFPKSYPRSPDLYFREAISWSNVSTGDLSLRWKDQGTIFEASGPSVFCERSIQLLILGFLNSTSATPFAETLSVGLHYEVGQLSNYPLLDTIGENERIQGLVEKCISLARDDWDSFEVSWGFKVNPLIGWMHALWDATSISATMHHYYGGHPEVGSPLELCYMLWKGQCQERFDQLKANEEELNSIFAGIYGMEGEVPIEVPDDKVSVRLADLGRDIRSLISYGVGCMFGRYSLDKPGLILADEGSTLDDYHTKVPNPTFEPDRTGIIPITDADTEWFEDDIVAQFRRWLAAAYGQDTLDENIAFIEHALGKSLRAYFVRDFYDDHLKTYQKRPIYWLFQSPKKGLSALMYLHRYNPNTVTTLLTEYIRPLREQMEAQARLLEVTGNARDVSTATKYRASIDELDKWEHDVIFPLSQKHVALDLDDGVKANYGKPEFKGALRKVAGLN